ncbi:hypothetical protein C0J52_09542, partial [Blattella germanica]
NNNIHLFQKILLAGGDQTSNLEQQGNSKRDGKTASIKGDEKHIQFQKESSMPEGNQKLEVGTEENNDKDNHQEESEQGK